jgi:hypothetical protein
MKRYYEAKNMYKSDSGMLKSDWSKPAGLPQEVMNKDWPACDYGIEAQQTPMLFDGANKQMREESAMARKERSNRKY